MDRQTPENFDRPVQFLRELDEAYGDNITVELRDLHTRSIYSYDYDISTVTANGEVIGRYIEVRDGTGQRSMRYHGEHPLADDGPIQLTAQECWHGYGSPMYNVFKRRDPYTGEITFPGIRESQEFEHIHKSLAPAYGTSDLFG